MTDAITRNTIALVQSAFFETCDLIEDTDNDAISPDVTRERLLEIKDLLATIETRLEG